MKTTTQKIAGIAIVVLFNLSLNAQNTKSVHFVKYTPEASIYVSKRMERISFSLLEQVQKLATWVKYVPEEIKDEAYTESTYDFSSIEEQLSVDVLYVPSSELNIKYEESEYNEINSILDELEQTVKYSPSEEVLNHSELEELTAELEKTVRFYPVANI